MVKIFSLSTMLLLTTLATAHADTIGEGASVVGAELGWPDLSLSYTRGVGARTDVGVKLELIYGVEGTTTTQLGFGLRAPLRFNVVRRDKVTVLFHADPGIKMYTVDPVLFGFQLPFGLTAAYHATRELSVGMGADVGFLLAITGPSTPIVAITPVFGPELEYRIDDQVIVGVNLRFGPAILIESENVDLGTAGGTLTRFSFRAQVFLGYRL